MFRSTMVALMLSSWIEPCAPVEREMGYCEATLEASSTKDGRSSLKADRSTLNRIDWDGVELEPSHWSCRFMSESFVHRPTCELCGSDKKSILVSRQFTDPAIWDFLEQYYEARIDKDDLGAANYQIAKCLECGFIWQAYILNDELMKR